MHIVEIQVSDLPIARGDRPADRNRPSAPARTPPDPLLDGFRIMDTSCASTCPHRDRARAAGSPTLDLHPDEPHVSVLRDLAPVDLQAQPVEQTFPYDLFRVAFLLTTDGLGG